MARCCAVRSVLTELLVLCRNLPKKRHLFSTQALHAPGMWAGRECEG